MKIIFTVTNDLSYDQRMMRICESLSAAGYEVELVGRLRKASIPLPEKAYCQTRLNCRFEKGKLFYLEYNIRLLTYLLFQRFDALCAIDLDTILPCLWASRLHQKPCVYDAHEYFTEVPEVVRRSRIRKVWERVADYAVPRMKLCYTVGDGLAELLSERYGLPFHSIRNVPVARVAEHGEETMRTEKIILYQGALNEGRGLEVAIEAMQDLEGAVLWLVGEGDLSDALREQVQHLGLLQKVHFLGYMQPHDLPAITAKAWIGLNLLENKGLSYYYSLANKAFDYIQAGLPSVQMDFPEYRRLNEEWQVFEVITELDARLLQQVFRKLLDDGAHYQKLHENCLKAAPNLTWEKESEKLLALYQKLFA